MKIELNKTRVIFFSREKKVLVFKYKVHESFIKLSDNIKDQGSA